MKTRRNKIGGHKVDFTLPTKKERKNPKPLTGKYMHRNNCLACALYTLGLLDTHTARYLSRVTPMGASHTVALEIIDRTYGGYHSFELYSEKALKQYLEKGKATLGYYGGLNDKGQRFGHYFVVFHNTNGKIVVVDSQNHTVTSLSQYLHNVPLGNGFKVLTEPDKRSASKPIREFIIPEVIQQAIDYEEEQFAREEDIELARQRQDEINSLHRSTRRSRSNSSRRSTSTSSRRSTSSDRYMTPFGY